MKNEESSAVSLLIGSLGVLVLGGAAGYLLGVLNAPASGEETRRRMGRRLEDERDAVSHKVLQGRRALDRALDRVVDHIEQGLATTRRRFDGRPSA